MAHPEGYRKALGKMQMAAKFGLPIVCFIDTPGAYPGIEAEERGQAEAIARSIEKCLGLTVPIVSVVIGEGGSGGAIAIAAANRVLMMEYAIYSVISPEGCASILWRSADYAEEAAEALKMTADDLLGFGVIDSIIPEPLGAAHRIDTFWSQDELEVTFWVCPHQLARFSVYRRQPWPLRAGKKQHSTTCLGVRRARIALDRILRPIMWTDGI